MSRRLTWTAALAALATIATVPGTAYAQGRELTGRVIRLAGESPIADATLSEVGGPGVARTGPDGTFKITVVAGQVRILVRAIGYQRKEVVVNAGVANVTVRLEEDPFKLEEVVVTGQTTTLERRNATTATVKIASDELTNAPAQALEQALQGKVLGANVYMNSGAPGGGAQIQIRGITSILGQGQPLFVVDGVLISNDQISAGANSITAAGNRLTAGGIASTQDAIVNRVADINPSEIESIEVLKSAAASALYGSRATNGVVVIRTKRGAPGEPRFNVTGRLGTSKAYRLLGTRQFETVQEVLDIPYGNGLTGEAFMNQAYPDGKIPFTRDYQKEFYDNSTPSYEVGANFSGGSQGTQYYVNLTQRRENGTAPNTDAQLQALRTNYDQSFANGKFKVNVGLNVTRNTLQRGLSNNDNTNTSPIYLFAYTPGVINLDSIGPNGLYVRNPFNGGGNTVSNPFETFEYLRLIDQTFRQIGNASGTWSALSRAQHQVSVTIAGGFDRAQTSGDLFSPSFVQYESPTATDAFSGRSVRSEANIFNYNVSLVGSWAWQPMDGLSLTTTGGTAFESQDVRVVRTRARGMLPGVETTGSGTILDFSDGVTNFRDQAFFLNEQALGLSDRLAVTAGLRADKSSANGDRAKYYVFPRGSASYRIPDLLGNTINELKLRGGWGRTGNRPRYADRDLLLAAGGVIGGSASLVQAQAAGNPEIKPETLTEIEAGMDLTIVNRRIQLEGTWYSRKITDLLLTPATIPSGGLTSQTINGGELSNKGWELGLNAVAIQKRDLDWALRATWQKNDQRIENLPSSVPRFIPGGQGAFGAGYGRNYISPCPPDAKGCISKTTWIWGNVPLDANGKYLPKGIFVTDPRAVAVVRDTVAGDSNPDFVMNFNSSLRWKRLTFAFTMDWRKGGDVSDMTHNLLVEGGVARTYEDALTHDALGAGWVSDLPSDYTLEQFRYDAWTSGDVRALAIEDGGFVRVRDISLSYEAPRSWAQALGGRSVRLTFQARNPFMFTNYWSFDPEFNNFGSTNLTRFIDLAPFPSARSFWFSVDVGW